MLIRKIPDAKSVNECFSIHPPIICDSVLSTKGPPLMELAIKINVSQYKERMVEGILHLQKCRFGQLYFPVQTHLLVTEVT